MRIDLDEHDDWVRVRPGGPERDGKAPHLHFRHSRLFTAKAARRGAGLRVEVPDGAPRFVLSMGYTQRPGIGADSRTLHRNRLRAQATYNGRDGKLGWAHSFDKDGAVDRVWPRVEAWEDDKRYFRASLNPEDHGRISDWSRFVREFMEVLQHGSGRTFDPKGAGLHWHADGLLTDEDRAAGHSLDWVASIHRETGRTHAHLLVRAVLGRDDLYLEPGAVRDLWQVGRGVASMDHHVGMQLDRSPGLGRGAERAIRREAVLEDRAALRRAGLDLEVE